VICVLLEMKRSRPKSFLLQQRTQKERSEHGRFRSRAVHEIFAVLRAWLHGGIILPAPAACEKGVKTGSEVAGGIHVEATRRRRSGVHGPVSCGAVPVAAVTAHLHPSLAPHARTQNRPCDASPPPLPHAAPPRHDAAGSALTARRHFSCCPRRRRRHFSCHQIRQRPL